MKFAVVDVETTGGDPKRASITEIGIVVLEHGEVIQTYCSLVRPLQPIPPQIVQLTGITNEMVENAPPFELIADEVKVLLTDAVFVAHHVLFDYRFIQQSFKRIGMKFDASKRLCTARYARKLYPKLRGYSLAKLCKAFGVENKQAHRAFEDAEATAKLLSRFLHDDEHETFKTFFKQRSSVLNLPHWLTKEELEKLPQTPGVYKFYTEQGKLVYIGKAKNIAKRVKSHFTGDQSRVGLALHGLGARLEFEITGTELMAQLIEDHEIRHYWPALNRAQKANPAYYHIVCYRDREGMGRLGIHRKRQCLNSIKQFYSLYAARNWMITQVAKYGLNPKWCHVSTWSESEEVSLSEHEEALEQFLAGAAEEQESYVLLQQGRTRDETGFVWVENDIYKGTGFLPDDAEISSSEDLELYLEPRKSSPTANAILEAYRFKHPYAKYLRLNSLESE